MNEVFYIDEHGNKVRGFARLKIMPDHAYGCVRPQWFVGDKPLSEVRQISRKDWFEGDWPAWRLFV